MCATPNSSVSRTSTSTMPFPRCSATTAGSTSSIWLLTWRSSSAPDGVIRENSSKGVGFRYFRKDSVSERRRAGSWNRGRAPIWGADPMRRARLRSDDPAGATDSPTMNTPSPPARLLLRRQFAELEHERAAVEQLRTRLDAERRAAGAAAIRAQEQERQRLAQDLHDEVNQALTAILLRPEGTNQQAPRAPPG